MKSQAPRFDSLLKSELGKNSAGNFLLSFSDEAAAKMEMMRVRLSPAQFEKLMEGVREAAAKGSEKSLVMMDGLAFTVDVRNGKILDVSDRSRIDTKAYTQIDSVVETRI